MTKRDAILVAAERLFSRNGFGLTGVDALAAAAGVTKRTLYKQFGSKEGLFAEWLRARDLRTRRSLLAAIDARAAAPGDRMLALFDILAQLAGNPGFHGCPFSRALLEFGDAAAHEASRQVAAAHKAELARWFTAELAAAGVADPPAAAEELALLYEGVLQRIAATRSADAAHAARRIWQARLAALGVAMTEQSGP
ncbi:MULTISPECIES: TetR/AcrR family transcriptional regulator [unclassified Sphingopyxis]|jgi:AcrR family transcriptional regulator|uniref:TetR/AcrR family transcriptional regulator n=1 Tax=unclassified Sphingopyxis TaxID=2614943 RepID=UPI0025D5796D|nr:MULTISPECIES: TetR/AcrR family transcriptional regulator [unclassified Sphingopyxis]